jgi:hypothetical protein
MDPSMDTRATKPWMIKVLIQQSASNDPKAGKPLGVSLQGRRLATDGGRKRNRLGEEELVEQLISESV